MRNRSPRLLAAAAILIIAAASATAFDWGGRLSNTTGIAGVTPGPGEPPIDLIQSDKLSLWIKQPLGSWAFNGEGSLTYTVGSAIPFIADLDRFNVTGQVVTPGLGPAAVDITVGRAAFSDVTNLVLQQKLDGLRLMLGRSRMQTTLGVATTALIINPSSGIVLSPVDAYDRSSGETLLTTPRVIAQAQLRLLNLFGGQNVVAGAVVQEDLRPQDSLNAPGIRAQVNIDGSPNGLVAGQTSPVIGRTDTQYLTLQASGPIITDLFQKTFYVLNTGRSFSAVPDADSPTGYIYDYAPILAHMAGMELNYYLPAVLNSRVKLHGLFSTGDADHVSVQGKSLNTAGRSTSFVPLTLSGFSDVFTLQPGNSANIGVSYLLRPLSTVGLEWIQTEAAFVSYLRTAGGGPVSASGVDAATTQSYVGSELDVSVTAQPFSDLRVSLGSGFFFPNGDIMNETLDYQVTLEGVLRF